GLQVRVDRITGLPAEAADERVVLLVRETQCAGGQVALVVAFDLDALGQHGHDRAVLQRALAEGPARAHAEAQVAAVGRAAVDAGRRVELNLAGDVVVEPGPAGLCIDPERVPMPADETTQRGVALLEVAAAQAPVDVLASDPD